MSANDKRQKLLALQKQQAEAKAANDKRIRTRQVRAEAKLNTPTLGAEVTPGPPNTEITLQTEENKTPGTTFLFPVPTSFDAIDEKVIHLERADLPPSELPNNELTTNLYSQAAAVLYSSNQAEVLSDISKDLREVHSDTNEYIPRVGADVSDIDTSRLTTKITSIVRKSVPINYNVGHEQGSEDFRRAIMASAKELVDQGILGSMITARFTVRFSDGVDTFLRSSARYFYIEGLDKLEPGKDATSTWASIYRSKLLPLLDYDISPEDDSGIRGYVSNRAYGVIDASLDILDTSDGDADNSVRYDIRVAYGRRNCVLQAIEARIPKVRAAKVYGRPTDTNAAGAIMTLREREAAAEAAGEPLYFDANDIINVAKATNVHIRVWSIIGHKLGLKTPWFTAGNKNQKTVDLVAEDSHVFLKYSWSVDTNPITEIVYHVADESKCQTPWKWYTKDGRCITTSYTTKHIAETYYESGAEVLDVCLPLGDPQARKPIIHTYPGVGFEESLALVKPSNATIINNDYGDVAERLEMVPKIEAVLMEKSSLVLEGYNKVAYVVDPMAYGLVIGDVSKLIPAKIVFTSDGLYDPIIMTQLFTGKGEFTGIYSCDGLKLYATFDRSHVGKYRNFYLVYFTSLGALLESDLTLRDVKSFNIAVVDTVLADVNSGHKEIRAFYEPVIISKKERSVTFNTRLHKTFTPSVHTGKFEDDNDEALIGVHSVSRMIYKRFEKANREVLRAKNVVRSSDEFRLTDSIYRLAEHFITRRAYSQFEAKNAFQLDHNKNYLSYKKWRGYVGFPNTGTFATIIDPSIARCPCFYGVELDGAFIEANRYGALLGFCLAYRVSNEPTHHMILPKPTYDYLVGKAGASTVRVLFVVDCEKFIDVDIMAWFDTDDLRGLGVEEKELKLCRNRLVGMTITGGIDPTDKITARYTTQGERDQFIHEAVDNQLEFSLDEGARTFSVYKPKIMAGSFSFHSYILSYAACHVMNLLDVVGKIPLAINVDAVVYPNTDKNDIMFRCRELMSETEPGLWKYEAAKTHYEKLTPVTYGNGYLTVAPKASPAAAADSKSATKTAELDGVFAKVTAKLESTPVLREAPNRLFYRNTVILGPAGVGKSYPFLKAELSMLDDQIILTPTCRLREAHNSTTPGAARTVESYYHLDKDFRQWKRIARDRDNNHEHKYVIIDEFTQLAEGQLREIIRRAGTSTLILLGDRQQTESIYKAPSPAFLAKEGFDTIYKDRDPNAEFGRHSYEDGKLFDSILDYKKIKAAMVETEKAKGVYNGPALNAPTATAHWRIELEKLAAQGIKVIKSAAFEKLLVEAVRAKTLPVVFVSTHVEAKYIHAVLRPHLTPDHVIPLRNLTSKTGSAIESKRLGDVDPTKIWWSKNSMDDQPPEGMTHAPAIARTVHGSQGTEIASDTFYVLVRSSILQGALYTAMTRCRSSKQIVLVDALDKGLTPGTVSKKINKPETRPDNTVLVTGSNIPTALFNSEAALERIYASLKELASAKDSNQSDDSLM